MTSARRNRTHRCVARFPSRASPYRRKKASPGRRDARSSRRPCLFYETIGLRAKIPTAVPYERRPERKAKPDVAVASQKMPGRAHALAAVVFAAACCRVTTFGTVYELVGEFLSERCAVGDWPALLVGVPLSAK